MGLDMYAYTKNPVTEEVTEIAYWRKHNALQGWMLNLWESKFKDPKESSDDFNCAVLNLTLEDIERLEKDIISDNLSETEGFFYGSDSRYDDYKKEQTLRFIMDAKVALHDGLKVYYSSDW
jgi:hypothetical protein